jgi:hypothetical protein
MAAAYEALAKDLLFWIMRDNFNTGDFIREFSVARPAPFLYFRFTLSGASGGLIGTNSSQQSSTRWCIGNPSSAAIIQRPMLNGLRDFVELI